MARKGDRQKQAKRDRKPVPVPEPERWKPPALEECEQEEYTYYFDMEAKYRVTQRMRRWHEQLVDYAVVLCERQPDGSWVEITCIDCCHGNVHRHDGPHGTTPPKVLRPILDQIDVQESFGESCDLIFDSYIEYVGEDVA